jgi:hypothetical protein
MTTSNTTSMNKVSQQDLARLHALAPLAHEYDTLRHRIVSALDDGAVPEAGDFLVDFRVDEEPLLTVKKLADALGLTWRQLRDLRDSVPPTRFRRLRVFDRRDPGTQAPLAGDALAEEGGAG